MNDATENGMPVEPQLFSMEGCPENPRNDLL